VKLKVVACGVFEPELKQLADESPNEIHLHFLDAGLHATPDVLREQAQAAIDSAAAEGFDAVVLGYGLCGRGTSGLLARDIPVVIPRVHDCMTLFLGSREEYRRQFSRHPGTFYTTPGWYEKKALGDVSKEKRGKSEDLRQDPRFSDLARKYGEVNAEHIIYFFDSWKRNYTRAAFIDTGAGDRERYERYARGMAEDFGWIYERLEGDTSLLAAILAGEWNNEHVFVLRPGQRSMLTGDERIFAAVDVHTASRVRADAPSGSTDTPGPLASEPPAGESRVRVLRPAPPREAPEGPSGLVGLGIDAGGTYTDCVLYDLGARRLLAKAKALTTRHDLMVGINEGLDRLDIPDPSAVRIAALSTTLATNAIVEGKGGQPGAIIMPGPLHPSDEIRWQPLRLARGAMTIKGIELEAVDREQVSRLVDELLELGVDAFAVSGYASVANPKHELAVKEIIRRRCDLPIVCGHELSSRLNYISRANTAILNARLLPLVRDLVRAVESSLESRGISARLMVVKGDGSLIGREMALDRPIETVLSGPAASIGGAKHLTGLSDAIVLDMGGTTTDTAIVEDGLAHISPEGARVGGWLTSVEAADISTIGLGGDSYLNFTVDRKLLVGPRRVIPLAFLCHHHPATKSALMALDPTRGDHPTPAALDFFTLARPGFDGRADDTERHVIEALSPAPLSRNALAQRLGLISPVLLRLGRLEELGVVQRSALTPTDILHVTGEFAAWDVEAAEHALNVFARVFGAPPEEIVERVRRAVVERLAGQIIAKEVPGACGDDPDEWPPLLRNAFGCDGQVKLRTLLEYDRPIVAIGAPVEPFFPAVGEALGAEVVIPEHADVANAIGAIAGEVVVRERAVIRPGEIANYVVHARSGRAEYEDLRSAIESAKESTASLAQERARHSGTAAREVKHTVKERRAFSSEGDRVLVEVLVEATVTGTPQLEPNA
jgi:N-methylhydantoinase A/oxoprolinase/acetone carboxylase beta subunit